MLRRARGGGDGAADEGDGASGKKRNKEEKKESTLALKAGFYRAIFRLRRTFSVRDFRYKVPWVLSLGTRPLGEGLLAGSGVSLPFGPPPPGDASGSRWWFCDGGVFLEVPGASASAPDGAESWRRVLGELTDHRPERPVDSLVLAVSSRELRSAAKDPTGRQELEKAADVCYERVWQAQRRLGLRLPIYLVVTDCESLSGFAHLAGRLREPLRRQIFGWSNPYALDTAYRSDWIREAFATLGERLRRVLIELFTERPPAVGGDEIFLFPREIRALEEPLTRFSDRVLKPSSYHEPMMLRGIFFTGGEEEPLYSEGTSDEGSDLPLAVEATGAGDSRRSFLLELVEQKIFPEGALAQPTAGRVQSRSRSVRIAQVLFFLTAFIIGFGTWRAYTTLAESNEVLVPFLEKFSRDLAQVYTARSQGLPADRGTAKLRAAHFAEGLSKVDISQYRSVFLPTSWFDPVDGELRRTMRIGFEQIIAEALRVELEDRVEDLLHKELAPPPAAEAGIFRARRTGSARRAVAIPLERNKAFQDLRQFVEELVQLDQSQRLFNNLRKRDGAELERLALLAESLFRYQLPEGFFENSGLYASALAGGGYQEFKAEDFRNEVANRLRGLSLSLDRALYEDSTLITVLEDLVDRLDGLRSGSWLRGEGREAIRGVVERLGEADDLVASEAVFWAFGDRFDLGSAYRETMALAGTTEFLAGGGEEGESGARTDVVEELVDRSEASWVILRRALRELRSDVTGPILAREGERILPALSADVQVLHAALLAYRSERFLADRDRGGSESRSLIAAVPGGALRRWDTIYLEQAIQLYEAYLHFRDGSLKEFPEGVRESLRLVARTGLFNQMREAIRQAQSFTPRPVTSDPRLLEVPLREEVELFQAAAPALNRLLAILDDLQLREAKIELEKAFLDQGAHFLAQTDGLLKAKELYQSQYQDFSWWTGNGNLAFQSFGVEDEADLVSYLDLQREEVRHLGRNLAQPVVNSLGAELVRKSPETQALHLAWQGILSALTDYDEKKPGNSVAGLEKLIHGRMSEVAVADCSRERVAPPRAGVRIDFFASRELDLRRGLYQRCLELASQKALSSYAEVAGFFNQHLAGRYPFTTAAAGSERTDADPEMVKRFFELLDPVAGDLLAIPESHPRFSGRGPEALDFVRRMRRAHAFFAPFVGVPAEHAEGGARGGVGAAGNGPAARSPASEARASASGAPALGAGGDPLAEVPTYDLRVDFRVNREREAGASKVIRWTLGVGEREISFRDAEPSGRWRFGEPVRLTLGWASDAPVVPLALPALPGAWVEDRSLIFERRGPWALLSFLQDFESPKEDFEGFEDPRPHTLKFVASTEAALPSEDEEERKAAPALAKAPEPVAGYVRVVVLAPGKNEPLVLPVLPEAAPSLPTEERVEARAGAGGYTDGA